MPKTFNNCCVFQENARRLQTAVPLSLHCVYIRRNTHVAVWSFCPHIFYYMDMWMYTPHSRAIDKLQNLMDLSFRIYKGVFPVFHVGTCFAPLFATTVGSYYRQHTNRFFLELVAYSTRSYYVFDTPCLFENYLRKGR